MSSISRHCCHVSLHGLLINRTDAVVSPRNPVLSTQSCHIILHKSYSLKSSIAGAASATLMLGSMIILDCNSWRVVAYQLYHPFTKAKCTCGSIPAGMQEGMLAYMHLSASRRDAH